MSLTARPTVTRRAGLAHLGGVVAGPDAPEARWRIPASGRRARPRPATPGPNPARTKPRAPPPGREIRSTPPATATVCGHRLQEPPRPDSKRPGEPAAHRDGNPANHAGRTHRQGGDNKHRAAGADQACAPERAEPRRTRPQAGDITGVIGPAKDGKAAATVRRPPDKATSARPPAVCLPSGHATPTTEPVSKSAGMRPRPSNATTYYACLARIPLPAPTPCTRSGNPDQNGNSDIGKRVRAGPKPRRRQPSGGDCTIFKRRRLMAWRSSAPPPAPLQGRQAIPPAPPHAAAKTVSEIVVTARRPQKRRATIQAADGPFGLHHDRDQDHARAATTHPVNKWS